MKSNVKRLSFGIIFAFLASVLCLFGCGDIYEGLKITADNSNVVLYLDYDAEGNLVKTPQELVVTVEAKKGVSTSVITRVEDEGKARVQKTTTNGNKTSIMLMPENVGETILKLTTEEGGASLDVKINVEMKIKDVEFNFAKQFGVAKNGSLNLNNLLIFTPSQTTERKMNFTLFDEESKANAILSENGTLTIKRNANFVNNIFENGVPYVQVIATSVNNPQLVTEVIKISVIDVINVKNFNVSLAQQNGNLKLDPNSFGEYSLLLGKTNVGNVNVNMATLNVLPSSLSTINNNYKISANIVSGTNVVEVEEYNNQFGITALNSGDAKVEFVVDYVGYEGQFTQKFTVNVKVAENVPSVFQLYNETIGEEISKDNVLFVFDNYNTSSSFNPLAKYLKLKVVVPSDFANLKFSVSFDSNGVAGVSNDDFEIVNEREESVKNVLLENGSYIYIKHKSENNFPNWVNFPKLVFNMQYSLNPNGGTDGGYDVFNVAPYEVNVALKRGIVLGAEHMPSEIRVNLATGKNVNDAASSAVKLLTLPPNTKYEDVINKIVIENENLVSLEVSGNVVYLVPNTEYLTGSTKVVVETLLGQKRECFVQLFIPNAYENYAQEKVSPMFVTVENFNNHANKIFKLDFNYFKINEVGEITAVTENELKALNLFENFNSASFNGGGYIEYGTSVYYKTISSMVLLTNSSMPLSVFNFITNGVGTPKVIKIESAEILNAVSNGAYASITNSTTTLNTNNLVMEEDFNAETGAGVGVTLGYRGVNSVGNIISTIPQTKIGVKIIKAINNIELNANTLDLFASESVGALKTNLSSFNLKVYNQENGAEIANILNDDNQKQENLKVEFLLSNATEVITTLTNAQGSYVVRVEDIIKVNANFGNVSVQFSQGLMNYVEDSYLSGLTKEDIYNLIFQNEITARIIASVQQYSKPKLSATCLVNIVFAEKVSRIFHNAGGKGLYFASSDNGSAQTKTMRVYVERQTANNKNVYVLNSKEFLNISGVDEFGKIINVNNEISITPKAFVRGEFSIYLASEDSAIVGANGELPNLDNLKVENFSNVVAVRVKIADGSEAYPYEIYNATDLLSLNSENNKNKHFVLAANIDLSKENFKPITNFNGSLNGEFRYLLNDEFVTEQFYINNLKINESVLSNGAEIGLFANLEQNAKIRNLIIQNANLNVATNGYENISVGVVAGSNKGLITNTAVVNSIVNVNAETQTKNVFVGGVVGVNSRAITANDLINTVAEINITTADIEENISNLNVGGVAGAVKVTEQNNVYVSGFNSTFSIVVKNRAGKVNVNNANVGGIAGSVQGTENALVKIENNTIINLNAVANGFVGGIVGKAENAILNLNTLQFGKTNDNLKISVSNGFVGGIVGAAEQNVEVKYSYVVNFNQMALDGVNNLGNIAVFGNDPVYVGGIVGKSRNQVNIHNSYFAGSIFAENVNAKVGAFVGFANHISGTTDKVNSAQEPIELNNNVNIQSSYFNGNVKLASINTNNVILPVGSAEEYEFESDIPIELFVSTGESFYYYIQAENMFDLSGVSIAYSYINVKATVGTNGNENVFNNESVIVNTNFKSNVSLTYFTHEDLVAGYDEMLYAKLPSDAYLYNGTFMIYPSTKSYDLVQENAYESHCFMCDFCGKKYFTQPELCENNNCLTNSETLEDGSSNPNYHKPTFTEKFGYHGRRNYFYCANCATDYFNTTSDGLCDTCRNIPEDERDDDITLTEIEEDVYVTAANVSLSFDSFVGKYYEPILPDEEPKDPATLLTYNYAANGFSIREENEQTGLYKVWLKTNKLNGGLPVLFKENSTTNLLLTVIPSEINYEFGNVDESKTAFIPVNEKAIVFFNETASSYATENVNTYEIVKVMGEDETIAVVRDKFIYIYFGSDIEIDGINYDVNNNYKITASNNNVNIILNSKLQTLSVGYTTLSITSVMDDSIRKDIPLYITTGVSGIGVYKNQNTSNPNSEIKNYNTKDLTLVVGEERNYYVDVKNEINGVQYEKSAYCGYVLGIKLSDTDNNAEKRISLNGQIITVNSTDYTNFVFENLNPFKVVGVEKCELNISVTPFIKTTENFSSFVIGNQTVGGYLMNNKTMEYDMQVLGIAEKPQLGNTSTIEISPSSSTRDITVKYFTPNVKNGFIEDGENLYVNFSNIDNTINETYSFSSNKYLNDADANNLPFTINYISATAITETSVAGMWQVEYTFNLSSNYEWFKQNKGVDTNFELKFAALTNPNNFAMFKFNIKPTELKNITTAYYPSGERNSNGEINANESESDSIVPDQQGLFKIDLYPEINNADYVIISTDKSVSSYVGYTQQWAIADSESAPVKRYESMRENPEIYETATEQGIKLINGSYKTSKGVFFNGKFYVGVVLDKNAPQNTTIQFNIRAFSGNNEILSITKYLSVVALPKIEMSLENGEKEGVVAAGLGVGVNITLTNYSEEENGPIEFNTFVKNTGTSTPKIRVENSRVVSDYDAPMGEVIVSASITKVLNGFATTVEDHITLTFVKYKINSVFVEGVASGVMEVLNGVTNPLSININAEYHENNASEVLTSKKILENVMAGREYRPGTVNETINNWRKMENNVSTTLTLGETWADINFNLVQVNNYVSYVIKGVSVSANYRTRLRFEMDYVYNSKTGFPEYIDKSETDSYYSLGFNFSVFVKDNSTFDHPNPITTMEQLKDMQPGANYVLLNDIVLENWSPMAFNAASLDGNGFSLILKSFNFDEFNGQQNINAGIFSSVENKSVLKNITVDVSNMLISRTDVNGFVDALLNGVSENNIEYAQENAKINLTQFQSVVFGTLAATSNGTLTNCKVVNFAKDENIVSGATSYDENKTILHVFVKPNPVEVYSVVGGLVGVNYGSINNSYVGTPTYSGTEESKINSLSKTIKVSEKSSTDMNEAANINGEQKVNPFFVAGSSYLGGIASTNGGIITNSYTSGLGLINLAIINTNNQTGGFVVNNSSNASIVNSFSQGTDIVNYRAKDNNIYLSTKGQLGGFVYSNSGLINNAFSNIATKQNSGASGGFVFENSGTITNAYTTSMVALNNNQNGNFTGLTSGKFNNTGKYVSCYYMLLPGETPNANEPATEIMAKLEESSESSEDATADSKTNPFRNSGTFSGYLFASGNSVNGIWKMPTNTQMGPQLLTCESETFSLRNLVSVQNDIYNYEYHVTSPLGSKLNPLLINTAEEFITFILNNSVNAQIHDLSIGKTKEVPVFGIKVGASDNNPIINSRASSVRLINNLDFSNIVLNSNEISVDNKRLRDLVFLGDLDGNGFSMNGVTLVETNKDEIKENFGLFDQVGLSEAQIESLEAGKEKNPENQEIINSVINFQPTLTNLNINVNSIDASSVVKVGAIAGSIYSSNLFNININYSGIVSARNIVGGVAGVIESNNTGNDVTISNVNVSGLSASTSYHSTVSILSNHKVSNSGYALRNVGEGDKRIIFNSYIPYGEGASGNSGLATASIEYFNNLKRVSYAGGIAGVMNSQNNKENKEVVYNSQSEAEKVFELKTIGGMRVPASEVTIQRMTVFGKLDLLSENTGGAFGYVGKNTALKDVKVEIAITSDNKYTKLMAYNFAGGVVAENYGLLEQVRVEYPEEEQTRFDEQTAKGITQGYLDVFKANQVSGVQDISLTAIGGIAGYNNGGSIIDSYSKVNVVNNLAKSAGGVIGLAHGATYLSHVYTTAEVYAQFNIGGVIGTYFTGENVEIAYKNSNSETRDNAANATISVAPKLMLDYVFGVNAWNTSNTLNTSYTFARDILKLYYLRLVNGDFNPDIFYNFNVKIPVYGNQQVTLELPDISNDENYSDLEKERYNELEGLFAQQENFIGSLVGRISNDFEQEVKPSAINAANLENLMVQSRVVKSANGLIDDQIKGSQVIPTVVSSTFTNAQLSGQHATGNWPSNKNANVIGDVVNFVNVETNEYVEMNMDNNQPALTQNGFGKQKHVAEILATNSGIAKIANHFQSWEVDAILREEITNKASALWKLEGIYPEYITGIYSHVSYIKNQTDFLNATHVSSKNKTYIVAPENGTDIELAYAVEVGRNFEGTLMGVPAVDKDGNKINPILKYKCTNSENLYALFAGLQNATISNVDFEFVIESVNADPNIGGDNTDERFKSFGMLARQVVATTIVNCNFKIKYNAAENENVKMNLGSSGVNNFGMLFGSVIASNIAQVNASVENGTTFEISNTSTNANFKPIQNIGAFAANISGNTYINGVSLKGFNLSVTQGKEINKANYTVGGLAGVATNSEIYNINLASANEISNVINKNDINVSLTLNSNIQSSKNTNVSMVGTIVGHLFNSSINSAISYGDVNVETSEASVGTTLAVGGIVGYNQGGSITAVQFNTCVENGIAKSVNYGTNNNRNITVKSYCSSNVGGLVGLLANGSLTSTASDRANLNGAKINISGKVNVLNAKSNAEFGIGGVVGKIIKTSSTGSASISGAANLGEINESVTGGNTNTDKNKVVYVGGVAGIVNGATITNVANRNNINLNVDKTFAYVGGIVGSTILNSSTYLTTITNYTSFGNINYAAGGTKTTSNTYRVGGVVGDAGKINVNNGYFVGKLNYFAVNANLCGIAKNLSSNSSNNYYVSEFVVGNDSENARSFADFVSIQGVGSADDKISNKLGNAFKTETDVVVKTLSALPNLGLLPEYTFLDASKVELKTLSNSSTLTVKNDITTFIKDTGKVAFENSDNFTGALIGVGQNTTINLSDNQAQLLKVNNGTLSNFRVNIGNRIVNAGDNLGLLANVNGVNGIINKVAVYGAATQASVTSAQKWLSAFVLTNSGKVINSDASVWFMNSNAGNNLYAIAQTNYGSINGFTSTSQFMDVKTGEKVSANVFSIGSMQGGELTSVHIAGYMGEVNGNALISNLTYDVAACGVNEKNENNQKQVNNGTTAFNYEKVHNNYGVKVNSEHTIPTAIEVRNWGANNLTITAYQESGSYAIMSDRMFETWGNAAHSSTAYLIAKVVDGKLITTDGFESKSNSLYGREYADEYTQIQNFENLNTAMFENFSTNSGSIEVSNIKFNNIKVLDGKAIFANKMKNVNVTNVKFNECYVTNKETEDSNADSLTDIGLLAGTIENGTIQNIAISSSKVTAVGSNVGGLIGKATETNLTNVTATGLEVNSTSASRELNNIGGLVGFANGGTISKINVAGKLTVSQKGSNSSEYVGGIIGYSASDNINNKSVGITLGNSETAITSAIAITAQNSVKVGGIVGGGTITTLNGTLTNSGSISAQGVIGGIIGILESGDLSIELGLISSTGNLSTKHVETTNNTEETNGVAVGGVIGIVENGVKINDEKTAKKSVNLNFNNDEETKQTLKAVSQIGAFVGINKGTIKNLAINIPKGNVAFDAVSVKNKVFEKVGVFAGENNTGEISNVSINSTSATMKFGLNKTPNNVGGIAGYSNGKLSSVTADVLVSGNENVGGVAGYLTGELSGTLQNGTKSTNTNSVYGNKNVGGVAGYLDTTSSATLTNNAAVNISANNAEVINKMNNGKTSENFIGENVGGVVGYLVKYNATLTNNAPYVAGKTNVGGISGATSVGTTGTVKATTDINSNSIWGNENVGGAVGNGNVTTFNISSENSANLTVKGMKYVGGAVGNGSGSISGKNSGHINVDWLGTKEIFVTTPAQSFKANFLSSVRIHKDGNRPITYLSIGTGFSKGSGNNTITGWGITLDFLTRRTVRKYGHYKDLDMLGSTAGNCNIVPFDEAGKRELDTHYDDPNKKQPEKGTKYVKNDGGFVRNFVSDDFRKGYLGDPYYVGEVSGSAEGSNSNSTIIDALYTQRWGMSINTSVYSGETNTIAILFAMYKNKVELTDNGYKLIDLNSIDFDVIPTNKRTLLTFISDAGWNETNNWLKTYLDVNGNEEQKAPNDDFSIRVGREHGNDTAWLNHQGSKTAPINSWPYAN